VRDNYKRYTMIPDMQSPVYNIRVVCSNVTNLLEKQTKNHLQNNYSLPLSIRIMTLAAVQANYYV
jgi:hypothetical protein